MNRRPISILAVFAAAVCTASGQKSSTGLPPPPPGFKALATSPVGAAMKKAGIGDSVEAEKPNENWPNCAADPKVLLVYSWKSSPGAGQIVEMMAQTPEAPITDATGSKEEPAGKQRYKDGVLIWRKKTDTVAGASTSACPDNQVVTYNVSWVGSASGKLLAVGVSHFYGSKAVAQAWIDEYIPKLVAAASGR